MSLSKLAMFLIAFTAQAFAVEKIHFGPLNYAELLEEDSIDQKLGAAPRFAVPRPVSLAPFSQDNWQERGEDLVWKLEITAEQAVSINLGFERFQLSDNARVQIYNRDYSTELIFGAEYNNDDQQLWTPIFMGEEVMVEVIVPKNEFSQNILELTKVNQGFRTFSEPLNDAGSCNIDVVCKEGENWRDEINSVAVISRGGSTFCTGFMVNNTENDRKPYFMTAYHCGMKASNAASLVAYWNYQTSQCKGRRDGKKLQFSTGAKHLAAYSASDFTLMLLNKQPKAEYKVTYAGWDRSGKNASKAIAIHHPNTDEKSISFEDDPTTRTYYLKAEEVKGATHVRVANWDKGTTEPGSSGSPLFDQDHRVIGQLHGGYASCRSKTADWYGSFEVSWKGAGTKGTRLSDFLDPEDTGDLTTDTL